MCFIPETLVWGLERYWQISSTEDQIVNVLGCAVVAQKQP